MIVVADSSPLIYLSRIGVLELLAEEFGEVVVPSLVWTEVVEARPDAPGLEALRNAPWLRVDGRTLPEVDLGLDPGRLLRFCSPRASLPKSC